jgi:uncharacterized protein DUF4062
VTDAESRHLTNRVYDDELDVLTIAAWPTDATSSILALCRTPILLHPVMFESGARPQPARAVYRSYLDQSDVFVGIYWQSYGWVGPGSAISGLEDELQLAERMPRLLYVKYPAPEIEPGLSRLLQKVRSEGSPTYKTFADAGELRELLVNDLATLLSERFGGTGRNGGGSVVPAPATELVGRERDVTGVASLVSAEDHRLVVLTGAGGVGKTRLALAVLDRTRSHWQDGAAFADLSRVTDPSLVPEAITMALGFLTQGREDPLDTLGRRLAAARTSKTRTSTTRSWRRRRGRMLSLSRLAGCVTL